MQRPGRRARPARGIAEVSERRNPSSGPDFLYRSATLVACRSTEDGQGHEGSPF